MRAFLVKKSLKLMCQSHDQTRIGRYAYISKIEVKLKSKAKTRNRPEPIVFLSKNARYCL